mmetsp:Transcript_135786/g.201951  ORF Transcript_135786/g.201951 Transcript_135786/m.201951 type:complete len:330 (-) Transcript_135786:22-1011(-)
MDLDDTTLPIKVSIPSHEIVDDVVMYEIVLQNGAITWKITRRYSAFFTLHKTLQKMVPTLPHFPGKHGLLTISGGTKDASFIKKRKDRLEFYLAGIIGDKEIRKIHPVKVFFDLDNLQSTRTQRSIRKSTLGGKAFGVDIEDFRILIDRKETDVPYIIEQCCSYVFLHGLEAERIFFAVPDEAILKKIEKQYNSGADVDFSRYAQGEYLAARTLYNFLASLPQPLLSLSSCSIINNISQNDIISRVHTLATICKELEQIRFASLRDTVCTLGLVVDNFSSTNVSLQEVAQLFAPVLLLDLAKREYRDQSAEDIVALLVEHRSRIFSQDL